MERGLLSAWSTHYYLERMDPIIWCMGRIREVDVDALDATNSYKTTVWRLSFSLMNDTTLAKEIVSLVIYLLN